MPLVSQTFDQLLDFTRTTSGTFVGSNGLIQNTPASVNLLLQTQQFDNAAWLKTNTTVTANSTTAPNGTLTADTLTATAGTAISVRMGQSGTTITATTYVTSFYVRPGTHTFVQIHINAQSADWVNFTLTGSGTVQNNGAAVGAISFDGATGYYRISATYTAGSTDRTPFFGIVPSGTATRNQTWNPTGTETVFVWGAQLEAAATATTYTRNNGGVFPPRFDYDPVTLAAKGILIEEQRTNLLLRSEEFDNAAWPKNGITVSANAGTSPDGSSNAETITEDTANTTHQLFQNANFTSGVAYTASVYVKQSVGTRRLNIGLASAAFGAELYATYNLSTLAVAVSAGVTATIENVGNGWYRCRMTATATATASAGFIFRLANADTAQFYSYTGDGTSTLLLYGAQLEAGAFATSYIPTVASQVTRTADQTSIVAPNFAPWYNQSEGTFVVSADTVKPTTAAVTCVVTSADDGTSANRLMVRYLTANLEALNVVSSVTETQLQKTYSSNSVDNAAFAYAASNFAFTTNGGAVLTDATGPVPVVNRLRIGNTVGVGQLNGHIRSVRYYPTRLSDAQLQALTA